MTTATTGIGLKRLQHLVLWVSNVERSVRFYRDILGFEVKTQSPRAAFLRIPGSPDDHHLGLFEHTGVPGPHEGVARMYQSAWEVGDITDLAGGTSIGTRELDLEGELARRGITT